MSKENIQIYDVVKKLAGPIGPVGESHTDEQRFENLECLCALVDKLVFDIGHVAETNKDSHMYSVKKAGEYADKFLNELIRKATAYE